MTYTLTSTDTLTIVSVSSDPDAATGIFGHVRQYIYIGIFVYASTLGTGKRSDDTTKDL